MIFYIVFAQDDEVAEAGKGYFRDQALFQELSGQPCLLVRYKDATLKLAERYRPRAIVMGGFGRSFDTFAKEALVSLDEMVKGTETPLLGICGSHQLNAMLYNRNVRRVRRFRDEPMRRLRPGEPDLRPDYHPGYFMETGFHRIWIVGRDPLFAGFGDHIVCLESHYCEVKRLPAAFRLLASTDECRIQAYRHPDKPLYGVQFHPEGFTKEYPEGRKVLLNFFRRIARTHR